MSDAVSLLRQLSIVAPAVAADLSAEAATACDDAMEANDLLTAVQGERARRSQSRQACDAELSRAGDRRSAAQSQLDELEQLMTAARLECKVAEHAYDSSVGKQLELQRCEAEASEREQRLTRCAADFGKRAAAVDRRRLTVAATLVAAAAAATAAQKLVAAAAAATAAAEGGATSGAAASPSDPSEEQAAAAGTSAEALLSPRTSRGKRVATVEGSYACLNGHALKASPP